MKSCRQCRNPSSSPTYFSFYHRYLTQVTSLSRPTSSTTPPSRPTKQQHQTPHPNSPLPQHHHHHSDTSSHHHDTARPQNPSHHPRDESADVPNYYWPHGGKSSQPTCWVPEMLLAVGVLLSTIAMPMAIGCPGYSIPSPSPRLPPNRRVRARSTDRILNSVPTPPCSGSSTCSGGWTCCILFCQIAGLAEARLEVRCGG